MAETHRYDDIINLPHPEPHHPRMPAGDRAAQFSPFAALTGYEEAVAESGRVTEQRHTPDGDLSEQLDRALRRLRELLPQQPAVKLTYFIPDARKQGGSYAQAEGAVVKLDSAAGTLTLAGGQVIAFEDITALTLPEAPAPDGDAWEPA